MPDELVDNYARFVRKTFGARARALGFEPKPKAGEAARRRAGGRGAPTCRAGATRDAARRASRVSFSWTAATGLWPQHQKCSSIFLDLEEVARVAELRATSPLGEFERLGLVWLDLESTGESGAEDPPDAITKEYRELLALDRVELELIRAALEEIVRYSLDRHVGARGLRAVMEHLMADVMFEAPERKRRSVRVDEAFVRRKLEGARLAL